MECIELIDGDRIPCRVQESKLKPILAIGEQQHIAERIVATVVGVYPPQIPSLLSVKQNIQITNL